MIEFKLSQFMFLVHPYVADNASTVATVRIVLTQLLLAFIRSFYSTRYNVKSVSLTIIILKLINLQLQIKIKL